MGEGESVSRLVVGEGEPSGWEGVSELPRAFQVPSVGGGQARPWHVWVWMRGGERVSVSRLVVG